MKFKHVCGAFCLITLISLTCFFPAPAEGGQAREGNAFQAARASSVPASDLIQPDAFAAALRKATVLKPLILHVGFRVLYTQAHIPGSEYIGPGNRPEGISQLRKRVESLPRTQPIVLYCGCCPWNECPNLGPAFQELRAMGFKDVKVLHIAQDFGSDWADKGYPVEAGK